MYAKIFTTVFNHKFPDRGVSAFVKKIKYETLRRILTVDFYSGTTYEYINVPITAWERAIKTDCIRTFLKADIIGRYESIKR